MENIKTKTKWFLESKYFILLLGALTLLFFAIDLQMASIFIMGGILILLVLFKCEFRCIIAILFLFMASWRNCAMELSGAPFILIIVVLAIAASIFLIDFVKNFKEYIAPLKYDWLFVSLFAILITMLISMINSPDMQHSGYGCAYMILVIVVYFFTRMKVKPSDESKDTVLFSIVVLGLVISLEMGFALLLEIRNGHSLSEVLAWKNLPLGWTHQNHAMSMINIAMIAGIYYFMKHRELGWKLFSILSTGLFLLMNVLMACRAGYIALLVTLPLCVILYVYYYKSTKSSLWKKDIPYFGAALGVGVIALIVLFARGTIQEIFHHLTNLGFAGNGRGDVYRVAFAQFKAHPILGSGVYTCHYYLDLDPATHDLGIWNYHNHVLQTLATTGILGMIAFIAYIVLSFRRCAHKDLESLFVGIILVYYLVHGCFDTLFYHMYSWSILAVLQAMLVDKTPKYCENKDN